jgi:Ca2+-transporting ATPase
MNWHLLPAGEVAQLLNTSAQGLSQEEVAERSIESGKNEIADSKRKSPCRMLLLQFTDFMIVILLLSAIVAGILGDFTDSVVIIIVVILNALIGFVQEYRAEKAMEALKKLTVISARVIREGITIDVPSADLVPGDVIKVEAGNILSADVRFFETYQLKVDESTLTGESINVEKITDELPEGSFALGDRVNLGFKGTHVVNGRGLAYVVATGMNTELGCIARMIQTGDNRTPLQKRLSVFSRKLSLFILLICAFIFAIGLLRGEEMISMLLTSISLAVAAIPEALPALTTIALAFGARRLAKQNVLIRKLPAVETLGSVTYICTDKTGTLTLNRMSVNEVVESGDNSFRVLFKELNPLTAAMALSNDVTAASDGEWLGDSTEVAMVQYAAEANCDKSALEKLFPRIAELPFDATRKCMTTLHQTPAGVLIITKGAVEVLFEKLVEGQKQLLPGFEQKIQEMAGRGYRILGLAMRLIPGLPVELSPATIESSLILQGFAGLMDPPRPEARDAVLACKAAGIIPVMITGDHALTATAIAKTLAIISNAEDKVLSGAELAALTPDTFLAVVENVRVYARVNPEQKLRIIHALQSKNHFVAMTGDGVNDAPALKHADIGIAMGKSGTEVAKEASHMILVDDNFSTIIHAVKEGRRIFDNILKFIKYILTGNAGEIWVILLAPFFGLPIPLLAIHILWINLVSDGLPGLALASEPAEANSMNRPPVNARKSIFSPGMGAHILWVGLLIGLVTIGTQAVALQQEIAAWQTIAFTTLCLSQMGHVMAIRSDYKSIFQIGVFSNRPMLLALVLTILLQLLIIYVPVLNYIFKTSPLSFTELAIVIAASSIVFWVVEIEKWTKRRRMKRSAGNAGL